MTIKIDKENIPLYKKIINEYEKNNIDQNRTESSLNKPEYTFKKDYYWMMGDNRHKSEDSRFWGFVPDDHIVGKPIFIWFSIKGINDGIKNWSIRWERVFSTVDGPGKEFHIFLIFFLFLFYGNVSLFIKKERRKNKMKQVLSPAYLPNIEYCSWLLHQKKVLFSETITYQKQSYRNRAEIYGANGKLKLIIPIKHRHGVRKTLEKEVLNSYEQNCQIQHWKSLCYSYRSSPYLNFMKQV